MGIEIRMWSTEAGKYFYDPQVFDCLKQQYCFDNKITNLISHNFIGEGFIFEQYIDQKDNTGVKLFVGDILFWQEKYSLLNIWPLDFYSRIYVAHGVPCHQIYENGKPDGVLQLLEGYYSHGGIEGWTFKKVGNENENPELLEVV
jgi:hypothetical protein